MATNLATHKTKDIVMVGGKREFMTSNYG